MPLNLPDIAYDQESDTSLEISGQVAPRVLAERKIRETTARFAIADNNELVDLQILKRPIPPLIRRVRNLEEQQQSIKALDVLAETVDNWFQQSEFKRCDEMLEELVPTSISNRIILALLVMTHVAKDNLPSRRKFYLSSKTVILRRDAGLLDYVNNLS